MLKLKGLIVAGCLALAASLCPLSAALAQGCGPQNPNCIVPTAPVGTSNNQAASTAFVQAAIGGGTSLPLAQGKIYIGSIAGAAAAQTLSGSGDCSISLAINGVATVTCTKTNGAAFATSATIDTTNASNISSGSLANARLIPGAANTVKGSVNGTTTSDLAIASCSAIYQFTQWVSGTGWQCGIVPVLPSRAVAATLNLSALSAVQTLGYATPGDGGGATFVKTGSSPFIDSQVTGSTTTAGSGCTNATYFGVRLTGGTGQNLIAEVTVSGGAVTAVNYTYSPGNDYSVGDVLSIPSATIGCSNASITITSVSSPLGSFTDSAGTHWQIVNTGIVNVLQFGASPSNVDNFSNIWAANFFATYTTNNFIGGGGYWGGHVFVPNGAYAICGSSGAISLEIPQGLIFEMASNQAATITACNAWNASTPVIELCDPNWQFTCFGAMILHAAFYASRSAPATGNVPYLHSNNDQDFGGVYDTYIYGGLRQCLAYEKGYGGASTFTVDHLSCSTDSASVQVRIGSTTGSLNVGTTAVRIIAPVLGGSSSGGVYQNASGIIIYGGFVQVEGGHAEEVPVGIEVANTASIANGMAWIKNFNAGSGAPAPTCTGVIQLDATNTPGNTVVEMMPASGSCTNTITNGQSGGTNFTGNITKPITCVSGACS